MARATTWDRAGGRSFSVVGIVGEGPIWTQGQDGKWRDKEGKIVDIETKTLRELLAALDAWDKGEK